MIVARLRLLRAFVITWAVVWCTGALLTLMPAVAITLVTGSGTVGRWVMLTGWGVSSAAAAWTACEVTDRLRERTGDAERSGPSS